MEWISGGNLRELMITQGAMAPAWACAIGRQVASAMVEAHRQDIVHRDLKPENVLICGAVDDQPIMVKVADFGMAKVLREGAPVLTHGVRIFGTPQYMSPERARGKPVDGATDVYALGLMLYEMVTHRRAFDGKRPMDVLLKQVSEPPPAMDDLPASLAKLVLESLRKDPRKRPTAEAMQSELACLQTEL